MYNPEIKDRFLAEFAAKNRRMFQSKFEAISDYELRMGKDFAEMNKDDAIEAIRNIKIGTYDSAVSVQGFFRNYIKWCEKNNIFTNVNPELKGISAKEDIDSSRYLRKMWFVDESDLISKMRMVRPFNEGYYEVVVLLFAWLGVSQDKILSIMPGDLDLESRRIFLDNGDTVINFSENIAQFPLFF